jgi:hypothetical protein
MADLMGFRAAMPAHLPLEGGCGCGAVRFRLSAPLELAGYCHCRRCQRRTGTAAAASGRTAPGTLSLTRGEDVLREWAPEDGWAKIFCSLCGSALWSRSPDDPRVLSVRLGAFDGDPGIRPSYRQFVAYAAPWEDISDDLPRFGERVDVARLRQGSG